MGAHDSRPQAKEGIAQGMITASNICRKASGVPVLSHDQIDALGEKLAGDFNPDLLKYPQELDIEALVELYMGLKLDFKFLSHCGMYLGMTVFKTTDRVIIYDPVREKADYIHADAGTVIIDSTLLTPKKRHRFRFTLGHEGPGHAFLHAPYYEIHPNSKANCAYDEGILLEPSYQFFEGSAGRRRNRTDEDWMEWQAYAMSSATLMPRCSIAKHLKEVQDSRKYSELADRQKPYYLIDSIMARYNVSFQAAMLRLKHFNVISDCHYYADCMKWVLMQDRYILPEIA